MTCLHRTRREDSAHKSRHMSDSFHYDLFLSHSATDNAVVRAIAEVPLPCFPDDCGEDLNRTAGKPNP